MEFANELIGVGKSPPGGPTSTAPGPLGGGPHGRKLPRQAVPQVTHPVRLARKIGRGLGVVGVGGRGDEPGREGRARKCDGGSREGLRQEMLLGSGDPKMENSGGPLRLMIDSTWGKNIAPFD